MLDRMKLREIEWDEKTITFHHIFATKLYFSNSYIYIYNISLDFLGRIDEIIIS